MNVEKEHLQNQGSLESTEGGCSWPAHGAGRRTVTNKVSNRGGEGLGRTLWLKASVPTRGRLRAATGSPSQMQPRRRRNKKDSARICKRSAERLRTTAF